MEEIVANRSCISVTKMCNDNPDKPSKDCDYCVEANKTRGEEEKTDELYCMGGFSSGKFRMDDFERALDMGACRSGDFMHFRNQRTSCCEVWNYRVKIGECKIQNQ